MQMMSGTFGHRYPSHRIRRTGGAHSYAGVRAGLFSRILQHGRTRQAIMHACRPLPVLNARDHLGCRKRFAFGMKGAVLCR